MNLSDNMKSILVNELRFAVERMKESKDVSRKLYFFSATYGVTFRIMNIEFDAELAFIHDVLNYSYGVISGRVAALSSGRETAIGIPEKVFDRLEEALDEMIGMIQAGQTTYPSLQRISNLSYSTTGNGFYLYLKGQLVV